MTFVCYSGKPDLLARPQEVRTRLRRHPPRPPGTHILLADQRGSVSVAVGPHGDHLLPHLQEHSAGGAEDRRWTPLQVSKSICTVREEKGGVGADS